MNKSEVNVILGSDNPIFDIYSKLFNKDYCVLVTTNNNEFLTNKIPTEINGNFYFKNCNIHKVKGIDISEDYIGGDVIKIEVKNIDLSEVLK